MSTVLSIAIAPPANSALGHDGFFFSRIANSPAYINTNRALGAVFDAGHNVPERPETTPTSPPSSRSQNAGPGSTSDAATNKTLLNEEAIGFVSRQ
ncbi:uncharacterized protein BP5553_07408 [Venustampulla echinocandica]|uniref:Uncharacterized protein n=1 Tax=Venustampulla echinocandica TaxID=2656787 RepID=A0A370TJE1_9HELO|nr:uncharacterized protein BP5553_07408 [Venustampulla echinocandica]RDL35477.1 hypothetical protein BP5553_07408 [Venustampulla echinocandica]